VGKTSEPPKWIKPQLTRNVDEAPAGDDWLHEIKYDGYRMHARLDRGKVQLLTRTGLDWSRRYPRTIEALRALSVKASYLDGELCALSPSGGDCLLGTAYPLDVHVATTMGCRLAEATAFSSIVLAASQAAALLYSAVAIATLPPEKMTSVRI